MEAKVSFQKGKALLRTHQYRKAITALTLAIELKPDHAEAYHKRGTAHYSSNSSKEACQDWKKACELSGYCMGWNFGLHKKVCGEESGVKEE
ncbi:MAG: tetratricopeptide repeat protein [SAR324 cluster bacterium]|nr:tetratricopeptide repeat protein [SAR324 cluster bacterium]